MDFSAKIKNLELKDKQVNITLSTYNQTLLEELEKLKNKDKELNVTIKRKSKRRSLDSNSLAWHLMEEIAKTIESDKDLVYLDMLSKYGVFTHLVVKPNMVPRMKEVWKLVKELGEVKINGATGIQLQCYFGSSSYDQSEMNRFINGVCSECRELGIPTPEDEEINNMVKEWGI